MREQLGQIPAFTRCRAVQVWSGDVVDDVDGRRDSGVMDGADILISKHA